MEQSKCLSPMARATGSRKGTQVACPPSQCQLPSELELALAHCDRVSMKVWQQTFPMGSHLIPLLSIMATAMAVVDLDPLCPEHIPKCPTAIVAQHEDPSKAGCALP